MPTIRQLEYLVAVADLGHFGRAADRCAVSQPTLSHQLQLMEDRLGSRLVERRRAGALLTDVGRDVVERARIILSERDNIRMVAKSSHDNPLSGKIVLGVIPTIAPYYLPDILPELHEKFPELKLYLREEQTEHLVKGLKDGHIDVAILALPVEDGSLRDMIFYEEKFVLALPPKHKLSKKNAVRVRDIPAEELMLLEEGHCLRDQALEVCQLKSSLHQGANFQATSLETLKHMVANGLGIAPLPERSVGKNEGYETRPFSDTATRKVGLVWRRTDVRNKNFQILASACADILK